MKKTDPRLVLAIAASGLVMALWLVLMSVIVWSTLAQDERTAVGDVLASRTALVVVGMMMSTRELSQKRLKRRRVTSARAMACGLRPCAVMPSRRRTTSRISSSKW